MEVPSLLRSQDDQGRKKKDETTERDITLTRFVEFTRRNAGGRGTNSESYPLGRAGGTKNRERKEEDVNTIHVTERTGSGSGRDAERQAARPFFNRSGVHADSQKNSPGKEATRGSNSYFIFMGNWSEESQEKGCKGGG